MVKLILARLMTGCRRGVPVLANSPGGTNDYGISGHFDFQLLAQPSLLNHRLGQPDTFGVSNTDQIRLPACISFCEG